MKKNFKRKNYVLIGAIGIAAVALTSVGFATWITGMQKPEAIIENISVTVDTDESWNYKLDIDYANEQCCYGDEHFNIINLQRSGNVCSALLTSDMLPYSGRYTMQLRGINDDGRVYHSEMFNGWVKNSLIGICNCQEGANV